MLFILFGSTAEMGKRSRQYFIDNGIEYIQKYHYIPSDFTLPARFGSRNEASKETVEKCDFTYEYNGMLVGVNKDQIIDAVRGRKKCLITASSHTIEFVRQIKAAYGEYVTVIGTYIDDRTLKQMFEALSDPEITNEELEKRLETGVKIKETILAHRELFDYIVMYGGEDSTFNFGALKTQYDYMVGRAEIKEKELNDKMYVELPYTGGENYAFVSYSHADSNIVFPVLHKLQLAGFRIWYDEGINGGENWRKIIASKIEDEKCRDFLLFASANSVKSKDVKAEINYALSQDKKIIIVRLDEAAFESDLEMYLSSYHYLYYRSDSVFEDKLIKSLDSTTRIR